jgi:DNA-binding transcriptional LysR family regulator
LEVTPAASVLAARRSSRSAARDVEAGLHSIGRVNVTRLRIVYELSRRGSVTAVADALWMTPSAVSQHLAAFERETETKLVERAGRGVRLTAAGRVLAEHGATVIAALDAAESALAAARDTPSGRLRVAAFPSVVRRLLPGIVAALRAAHPDLVIEIEDLEGAESLDAVRLGRVDLAVVDDWGWDAGAARDGLDVVDLFEDPLVVVLPAGHALTARAEVAWADLAGEAFIVEPRSSLFSHAVATACRRAGFEPRVHARVHDLGAMLALAEAAGYVCVLPALAVSDQACAFRPLVPTVQRRLLAAARLGQRELPAVRALLDALVATTSR